MEHKETFIILKNGMKIAKTFGFGYPDIKSSGFITYTANGISVSYDVKFKKYKFTYSAHEIQKNVYPKFSEYRIDKIVYRLKLKTPRLKRKENSYENS